VSLYEWPLPDNANVAAGVGGQAHDRGKLFDVAGCTTAGPNARQVRAWFVIIAQGAASGRTGRSEATDSLPQRSACAPSRTGRRRRGVCRDPSTRTSPPELDYADDLARRSSVNEPATTPSRSARSPTLVRWISVSNVAGCR